MNELKYIGIGTLELYILDAQENIFTDRARGSSRSYYTATVDDGSGRTPTCYLTPEAYNLLMESKKIRDKILDDVMAGKTPSAAPMPSPLTATVSIKDGNKIYNIK